MSLTNAAEQSLLDLLFLNTDWANIGDAGADTKNRIIATVDEDGNRTAITYDLDV